MRSALKGHILRKRQRLKQEIEQEAIEKRIKRERELKQIQDAMTLDQIKEQLNALERKLTNLRDEKHSLFVQLKQVLSEDSSRKKQAVIEGQKKSLDTNCSAPQPTHQAAITPNQGTATRSTGPTNLHKQEPIPQTPQQTPVSLHKPLARMPAQVGQSPIRAAETIHMFNKHNSSNIPIQLTSRSQNQPRQSLTLEPKLSQTSSPIKASHLASLAQADQIAYLNPTNLSRKDLDINRSRHILAAGLRGPIANVSPLDMRGPYNPLDFTQSRNQAHVNTNRYSYLMDLQHNRLPAPPNHDSNVLSATKRPYGSLNFNEPILDARKRPNTNSYPDSYPTIAQNIPNLAAYKSLSNHTGNLQSSHIEQMFASDPNFLRASSFRPELRQFADPSNEHIRNQMRFNPSNTSAFYPVIPNSHLLSGPLHNSLCNTAPSSQAYLNSTGHMNLQLNPGDQSRFIGPYNFQRKPFHQNNGSYQNNK